MPLPKEELRDLGRIETAVVAKHRMLFGAGERLSQFENYQFFSPALLYLYGGLSDTQLNDFQKSINCEVAFMFHRFNQAIFGGLDTPTRDSAWNHALWAIEIQHWPRFESFMLSVMLKDDQRKTVIRYGAQDITIMDPIERQRGFVSARAEIVVFGVDSNFNTFALTRPPPGLKPHLAIYPPRARTLKIAQALFGKQDIIDAVAPPFTEMPDAPKLRTQDISDLSPARQQEMFKSIDIYRNQA